MGEVKLMLPVPSQGLARQELTRWNAGDPTHLAVAIQDKLVRQSSFEEVKEALRYAMMKLGLRAQNLPSEIEKILIVQHVIDTYGGHTLEELRLGFDMAIAGKLPVDANCYENFSCEYISRIMGAYRKWSSQEMREMPALPPPVLQQENVSNFAMLRWLAQEIRYIKTGKPFEFIPLELYEYLDKRGKISASKEDKLIYLEKAAAWRLRELVKEVEKKNNIDNRNALQQFHAMQKQGYFTGHEIERIKALAKKLLFYDLVQKHY